MYNNKYLYCSRFSSILSHILSEQMVYKTHLKLRGTALFFAQYENSHQTSMRVWLYDDFHMAINESFFLQIKNKAVYVMFNIISKVCFVYKYCIICWFTKPNHFGKKLNGSLFETWSLCIWFLLINFKYF